MASRARDFFAVLAKTVNVEDVETLIAEERRRQRRALPEPQWMYSLLSRGSSSRRDFSLV